MKRRFWAKLPVCIMGVLFLSCASNSQEFSLADDYYNLARDLHSQKSYALSEMYYKKCLALNQSQEDCLFNLSLLYLETKKPDKAESGLRLLLDRDDKNTLILNSLGVVYSQKEEWERALEWYNRTLDQFPWDRIALINSALVYEKLSRPREAQNYLETLWEQEKTYPVFEKLYPYYAVSTPEERIRIISQVETDKKEEKIELDQLLLHIYLEEGLYEDSLILLDSLYDRVDSQNAGYLFRKGDILISLYRMEEGLSAIRQSFREGYFDRTEIDELSSRLAPSAREVLRQLEELYFPR